jgi:hypothetical protein
MEQIVLAMSRIYLDSLGYELAVLSFVIKQPYELLFAEEMEHSRKVSAWIKACKISCKISSMGFATIERQQEQYI